MKYLIMALSLVGCTHGPILESTEMILFTSRPSGIEIEVDNQYIGVTPIIYEVHRVDNGLGIQNFPAIKVVATPNSPEQCKQTKLLLGNQKLPTRIHFPMTVCPSF